MYSTCQYVKLSMEIITARDLYFFSSHRGYLVHTLLLVSFEEKIGNGIQEMIMRLKN